MLLSHRESALLVSLKKNVRRSQIKSAVAAMFNVARQAALNNDHNVAGMHYGALANYTPQNQTLPMRAARSYHKAQQAKDAARWYLEAAERYARMHQITQAIATLRLYHGVAPGEHRGPKRVFNICREQGGTGSGLYEMLSIKDRAVHKLRAEDIFAMFDDRTFDSALDAMIGRELKAGEVLTRTGEKAASIYIIVQGRVEELLTLAGKRTSLGHLAQGDVGGVIPYFTGGGRRTSDIVAVEESELLELPYTILDDLCQQSADFKHQLEALYCSNILTGQLALAPVFRQLDASVRNEISRQLKVQTVQAGEIIFREGEAGSDVYMVRSGSVAINLNADGQERQYKIVSTGALIGEISVAINGWRANTARAISDCQLAKLDGAVYQRLFDTQKVLQVALERRKKKQLDQAREYMRTLSAVDGDDTRELLLKDIWCQ